MVDQAAETCFEQIYAQTYSHTLRYVTLRCSNTEDIVDIMQEVYTELYTQLVRRGVGYIRNPEAFVIHLAKTRLARHYSVLERLKRVLPLTRFNTSGQEQELAEVSSQDSVEVEVQAVTRQLLDDVWALILKHPDDVRRIFYLYYSCDLELKEIAREMRLSESSIKNKLYRTLRDIRKFINQGGETG